MLTKEEWWNNMSNVNSLMFPWQFVMLFIAAILVVFIIIKPSKLSSSLMKLYMVLAFGWIGIGFSGIISGNYVGAALFSSIAIFFGIDIYKQELQFAIPENKVQRFLTFILLLIIFSYPLLGLILGHNSSEIFMIGTYPCPTTSLGLIMMTIAFPKVNKILYGLLLFWAIFSIPAILIYSVFEDIILLTSGIYATIILVKNWKTIKMTSK